MNESEFQASFDNLLNEVEQILENSGLDIDWMHQEGMLIITFKRNHQLILSRQSFVKELWLAAPDGAYHFQAENHWATKKGEAFNEVLSRLLKQYGEY